MDDAMGPAPFLNHNSSVNGLCQLADRRRHPALLAAVRKSVFSDAPRGQIAIRSRCFESRRILSPFSPLAGSRYRLENGGPEVSGGMVRVQNPRNGRIWGHAGGFERPDEPSFNRATPGGAPAGFRSMQAVVLCHRAGKWHEHPRH